MDAKTGEQKIQPDPPAERPRRRSARPLPDLAAILEAATTPDLPGSTPGADLLPPREPPSAQPAASEVPSAPQAQGEATSRRPRRTADLSRLATLGQEEESPAAGSCAAGEPAAPEAAARLAVPPELETYLSPDLWRKLSAAEPPRGVLINALERVRSVLYLLSTYLPSHLVQEKLRRPVPGLVKGQELSGTLLFSDVSGFTALSERLAVLGPEGAERLTGIMNGYFTTMLEILAWSGGILLKFAGDATLVYFPVQPDGRQAQWAVRAAQRMLRAMSQFSRIETPTEAVHLTMKIGIATGSFLAASVGSPRRMEYAVTGPAVTQVMAAEGATTGPGQLIVNAATQKAIGPTFTAQEHTPGFYRLPPAGPAGDEDLGDFEIKAEARRARGAIPWSASPQAILTQVEVALRQIEALRPYLPAELVERIVVHARRRRIDSEYRPTCVLFCNFTGFEALLEAWGSAGVQRLTGLNSAYFSAMNEVITRYGGIVTRIDPYSKGTKLLALFGAPVAHEDDPQRAVSAALAMNAELEALNEAWRTRFARHLPPDLTGPLVQHRIGLTSGSTFAGQVGSSTRREYTVMGDEVNLAARLMGAAEMGQLLVDQRISAAASGYFILTSLPAIRVKGKSKPIAIFQVEGPRDDTLAERARSRGALIGREAEIVQCEKVLRQALGGRGEILTLLGPPGIGKSHLADALCTFAAGQSAQVVSTPCRSYAASTPYSAWAGLLRALTGITSYDANPALQHAKLRRLLDRLKLGPQVFHPLAALLGLRPSPQPESIGQTRQDVPPASSPSAADAPLDRTALVEVLNRRRSRRSSDRLDLWQQLDEAGAAGTGEDDLALERLSPHQQSQIQSAVWALLSALAAEQPLVLFFEDAHHMDPASQALLAALKSHVQSAPVCILLARRGEAETPGRQLTLGPLDPGGTTALVAHLLVSELAQVIHEQSHGNPLFVEEITRWFQRTQNFNADGLRDILRSSNILQKLVLSSLESLPTEQREIARVASVIGGEFRTGEVAALLGDATDPVTLSNALRDLARSRLVTLAEAGADARYAFQQALVRDVLYNSLPFEQRRELHARLAEYLSRPRGRRQAVQSRIAAALEPAPTCDPAQEAEQVAYHYEQSQQWLQAARQLQRAAGCARGLGASLRASGLIQRALSGLQQVSAPTPGASDEEALTQLKKQLHQAQGDLALQSGDYPTALSAYEAARSTAGEAAEAPILFRLALAHAGVRRSEEAIALLSTLPGSSEGQSPASGLQIAIHCALTWLQEQVTPADMEAAVRESLAAMENSPQPGLQLALALLLDLSGSLEAAQEAYLQAGSLTGAALAALRQGDRALQAGDIPPALTFYRQTAASLSDRQTDGYLLALANYRQAEAFWRQGDQDSARQALTEALDLLDAAPPAWQAAPRRAIRQALKTVSTGKPKRWPAWRWQEYQDTLRVQTLWTISGLGD